MMFSDPTPSACCWHVLLVDLSVPGPAPDVVQEALGGSVDALYRFFDPADWARRWSLPLWKVWGRADEWRTAAGWWRETRERREGRYLSLAEINAGWDGSGGDA